MVAPQMELWEVKGELDSFKVYVDGSYRGFMFKINEVRGWLAQLLERDEKAYICATRDEAERWIRLQFEFEHWLKSRMQPRP
jgi:hypothetical protein